MRVFIILLSRFSLLRKLVIVEAFPFFHKRFFKLHIKLRHFRKLLRCFCFLLFIFLFNFSKKLFKLILFSTMRRFWSREEKKLTVLHKHISQKQKIWLLIKTLYFDYSALDVICVLMFNFLIIAILMNISICEKTENVTTFLWLGEGQCPPKNVFPLRKL